MVICKRQNEIEQTIEENRADIEQIMKKEIEKRKKKRKQKI